MLLFCFAIFEIDQLMFVRWNGKIEFRSKCVLLYEDHIEIDYYQFAAKYKYI